MNVSRRSFLSIAGAACTVGLQACSALPFGRHDGASGGGKEPGSQAAGSADEPKVDLGEFADLELDMGAWSYDKANDCYYQLGIPYCTKPATKAYESLAIFVPGAYLTGKRRMNGSYVCEVNPDGKVGEFTAATAPVALPINSTDFEGQVCPTSYSYDGLGRYLGAGMVYVYAGFRGRSATVESGASELIAGGAPWPVVDLKAAVRYLRYNQKTLPCDVSRVFCFGMGAGGGISACLGALGDLPSYLPYLEKIGAATHDGEKGEKLSDAVAGSASWCPIVSFDAADAGYEWMMGQFADDGERAAGTWTRLLSQDLATAYGDYIAQMDLVDADGNHLVLDAAEDGSYVSGSYYDYILQELEDSASAFLSTTSFPYTLTPAVTAKRSFPGDPNLRSAANDLTVADDTAQQDAGEKDQAADAASAQATGEPAADGQPAATVSGVTKVEATVFDSIESYVAVLNGDTRWLTYSAKRKAAQITDLWDFSRTCKPATRGVGAYDSYDRSTTVNQLFGVGEETTLHFDPTIAHLLAANGDHYAKGSGWDVSYAQDWAADLAKLDALDTDMVTRVRMANPLYGLSEHYDGQGTATVAPWWRINAGVFSSETPLTMETNLALELGACKDVKGFEFTPVWGAGFGLAERDGNAEDNLIAWIVSCLSKKK